MIILCVYSVYDIASHAVLINEKSEKFESIFRLDL